MIDLDHVAIATTDIAAALGALVGDLGGTIFAGGDGYGFRWVQTRLGPGGAGMTVELLVEWQPEQHDFLARFLARHGPGQHHLTFKVTDLAATLERVRTAGYRARERRPERPRLEGGVPPATRGARHRGPARARCTRDHPGTAELVAARRRGRLLRARVVAGTAAARRDAVPRSRGS